MKMAGASSETDKVGPLQNDENHRRRFGPIFNHDNQGDNDGRRTSVPVTSSVTPFAGRLGSNLNFVADRNDPENTALLEQVPDAAPHMNLRQALDLRGFRQKTLYKAALMESLGTFVLVYITGWIGMSPAGLPSPPVTAAGVFGTTAFLGPLIGGLTTSILLTLLVYGFGAGSGAHLNPLITMGTFFARLTTLPRMVLYIAFQICGASLAGLLLRASYDSRDFKAGGCFLFESHVSVSSAFAVEFSASIVLLVLAFGVGLDPRQGQVFGPALGPLLVGLSAGTVAFGTAFTRPGYGGAGLNPARCFGIFVGSHFPGWHWIHWIGPLAASIVHGLMYYAVPPWKGLDAESAKAKRPYSNTENKAA